MAELWDPALLTLEFVPFRAIATRFDRQNPGSGRRAKAAAGSQIHRGPHSVERRQVRNSCHAYDPEPLSARQREPITSVSLHPRNRTTGAVIREAIANGGGGSPNMCRIGDRRSVRICGNGICVATCLLSHPLRNSRIACANGSHEGHERESTNRYAGRETYSASPRRPHWLSSTMWSYNG
jgi:hypothetical protein